MSISRLWNFTRHSLPVLGIFLLAACASTPKTATVDSTIAANVKSARSAYEAGAFPRAAKFYELALARARALDDSAEIGRNAYNAAACHLRAGDAKAAAALLVEADREFSRSKLPRHAILLLQSRSALAMDRQDAAANFALEAQGMAKTGDERAFASLALADVRLRQGDVASAEKLVGAARTDSQRTAATDAPVANAEARLLTDKNDHAGAAKKLSQASELWRGAGNVGEMAAALHAAGNAYARAGDAARAADSFYRAARSYFGQHDNLAALGCIQAAMKAAETAKDENLRDQIAALFEQIKKSVEPAGESH